MKKSLYIFVVLMVCLILTGFRGEAVVFIEGRVVDNVSKVGIENVQVTFWDPVANRRYDIKTDSKGIWKWSLIIEGDRFQYSYSLGNIAWKIEYSKEGFTFNNASISKATLSQSNYLSYFPLPSVQRVYNITAYVEAIQIYSQNPISSPATIPSSSAIVQLGPAITLMISGYNKVPLEMKLIPAGTFTMGSTPNEKDRNFDESPQQQVTISQPFYLGVYEVTQEQWAAVMGTYPSRVGYVPTNPVEQVSWEDCQRFITKLNAMGIGTFRLPTEAEWEYACRAGTTTRFPWGDDSSYCLIGQYAWYNANSSVSKDYPVGQKKPNAWGLYDMHGNVWEWCSDWYGRYMPERQADPIGPAYEYCRVGRGGWHYNEPQLLRSAQRYGIAQPSLATYYLGFRLVRTAP